MMGVSNAHPRPNMIITLNQKDIQGKSTLAKIIIRRSEENDGQWGIHEDRYDEDGGKKGCVIAQGSALRTEVHRGYTNAAEVIESWLDGGEYAINADDSDRIGLELARKVERDGAVSVDGLVPIILGEPANIVLQSCAAGNAGGRYQYIFSEQNAKGDWQVVTLDADSRLIIATLNEFNNTLSKAGAAAAAVKEMKRLIVDEKSWKAAQLHEWDEFSRFAFKDGPGAKDVAANVRQHAVGLECVFSPFVVAM